MKNTLSSLVIAGLALGLATTGFAQANRQRQPAPAPAGTPAADRAPGETRHGGAMRHGPGGPRMCPLVAVLDTNQDATISAEEIAHAPDSLKALDKDGDGAVSTEELGVRRGPGMPPGVIARHRAGTHRPASPIMLALDADGDGALSAGEIANATASLQALDANNDGQLTADEVRPIPPELPAQEIEPAAAQ